MAMPQQYTSDQFWKLYKELSQELKDALFAEETGKNIYDVCDRNGVPEKLREVVDYVGRVLVGVLPIEDFQETLESKLEMEKDIAKKVAQEINRLIFYPVKPALEELYKIGAAEPVAGEKEKMIKKEPGEETEEKPEAPSSEDTYRELVE